MLAFVADHTGLYLTLKETTKTALFATILILYAVSSIVIDSHALCRDYTHNLCFRAKKKNQKNQAWSSIPMHYAEIIPTIYV